MEGVSAGRSGRAASKAGATFAKYNLAGKCVPKCNLGTTRSDEFVIRHSSFVIHPFVKKKLMRWKKTGAEKQSESIRSIMPPWPGSSSP